MLNSSFSAFTFSSLSLFLVCLVRSWIAYSAWPDLFGIHATLALHSALHVWCVGVCVCVCRLEYLYFHLVVTRCRLRCYCLSYKSRHRHTWMEASSTRTLAKGIALSTSLWLLVNSVFFPHPPPVVAVPVGAAHHLLQTFQYIIIIVGSVHVPCEVSIWSSCAIQNNGNRY